MVIAAIRKIPQLHIQELRDAVEETAPGLVRNEKVEAEFHKKDVMSMGWVEKNKVSDLFGGRCCKLLQCATSPHQIFVG